jgi:hypothetical protein
MGDLPPPYSAMRPVRAISWFFQPFFSTSCWAIVSPVAKSTAVVTLWVRIGREASFAWYLDRRESVKVLVYAILTAMECSSAVQLTSGTYWRCEEGR